MKLFCILLLAIMSWEPSCNPTSSSSSSGSSSEYYYQPSSNYERVYYSYFKGKIYDYSTGRIVYSATICAYWDNKEKCQLTGQSNPGGYYFKLGSSRFPNDVKIIITHPDYETNSVITNVIAKTNMHIYDFRLKQK